MKIDLYWVIKSYDRGLASLDHILRKGSEYALAQGVSEAEMLEWRLAPDMNPLWFQIATVINFYYRYLVQVLETEAPEAPGAGASVADYLAAIAAARAHFASVTPEQLAGHDEDLKTLKRPDGDMVQPLERWIAVAGTPNFYFHLTIAYALFRLHGAPLGKTDFMKGGFAD